VRGVVGAHIRSRLRLRRQGGVAGRRVCHERRCFGNAAAKAVVVAVLAARPSWLGGGGARRLRLYRQVAERTAQRHQRVCGCGMYLD
jgi:hypothetical protein